MSVSLGTTLDGTSVRLTAADRSRHVHVVGASGSGKSRLLEHLIRQDILAGRGLCLIDPHGTLADSLLTWCASRRMDDVRRIHILNPTDLDFTAGFNPLRLDGLTEPAVRVDAMVEACSQVWGGEDTNRTPLLKKCLRAVFYALSVRGLTLVESVELIGAGDLRLVRRRLTENLPDYVFASLWEEFNHLSRADFAEQFSSTNNRLIEFLNSPIVRRIVGQTTSPLDVRRIMDNGEILIVNLALKGRLSGDNARLLGTLLTSELFLSALGRDEATARARAFSLYIDECYDYLSGTIERILDQTRKFGLHAVLSHQRLGQLKARSEAIYSGVMAGAQTKVVFSLPDEDDAQVMARHLFRSSFNLERPKHVLDKPTVVGEEVVWLQGQSDTTTETSHESSGGSTGTTRGAHESSTEVFGVDGLYGEVVGASSQSGSTLLDASGSTTTRGSSTGHSATETRTQTFRPIRQVLPTAVYTLEEELHRAVVAVRELPPRSAILKRPGAPPVLFRSAELSPALAVRGRAAAFVTHVNEASEYLKSTAAADAEVSARLSAVRRHSTAAPATEDFWT